MDSIQAQLQIRQNATEAQDYAQDLLNWQHSLKTKATTSRSSQHEQHREQLPVRGKASGAVRPDPQTNSKPQIITPSDQLHPAAHTYKNYSKWDRFDVDAALEAADASVITSKDYQAESHVRGSRESGVSSVHDAWQQQGAVEPRVLNAPVASSTSETPAAKASALKDQGNKLFQAKYYDDALSCYTQSIEIHPTAAAYANRAMAYLKLERYPIEAEADCTAALALDPTYTKAWHRRATARKQLGKLLDAAVDFEEALRMEPGNTSVKVDRDNTLDQYLKLQQVPASDIWTAVPVKVLNCAAKDQSQLPQQLKQHAVKEQQHNQQQHAALQVRQQQGSVPVPNGVGRPATPTATNSRTDSAKSSPQQPQSVAAAAHAAAQQLAARLASNLRPPKTGHEFEAAWRSLKGDVRLQGKYLSLLQPQQLQGLFKSSLTAQLLSAFLTAALKGVTQAESAAAGLESGIASELAPAHAVALIEGLANVPRFDMMAMSLGSKDRARLQLLWDSAAAAAAAAATSQPDGDNLVKRLTAAKLKYRL